MNDDGATGTNDGGDPKSPAASAVMRGGGTAGRSEADIAFRAAALTAVVLVCGGIFWLRFIRLPSLPPKPAKPQTTGASERAANARAAYAQEIKRDSADLGVDPPATVKMLSTVFPYRVREPHVVLRPGRHHRHSLEAAGLKLTVSVERVAHANRRELVLSLDNPGDRALAYRVLTRPTGGFAKCGRKRDIPHNAMAVAAHATERRSECLYDRGDGLEIRKVETMAIPALSYFYVSKVPPLEIDKSRRTSTDDRVPAGKPCRLLLPGDVANAIASGRIRWRDAVDFYARHNCQDYTIPIGYKAFSRPGERALPVESAGGTEPAGPRGHPAPR